MIVLLGPQKRLKFKHFAKSNIKYHNYSGNLLINYQNIQQWHRG